MIALILGMAAGVSALMMGAWLVQRRTGNGGWSDVVWSFATGLAAAAGALGPGTRPDARQIVLAALAAAWSLRLGLYLWRRVASAPEDARYAAFRRDWGVAFEARMFGFLQIQALAAFVLALMVLIAAHNPAPLPQPGDIAGIFVLAIALLGEGIADAQLRRFKAAPGHHGKICDHGLWRLSRHPNYFFEWLVWVAFALFALPLSGSYPWGWAALAGPALMYWLLVHVSGIPPLEAQMLKSRGDAFKAYQSRTNAFFPGPPRR